MIDYAGFVERSLPRRNEGNSVPQLVECVLPIYDDGKRSNLTWPANLDQSLSRSVWVISVGRLQINLTVEGLQAFSRVFVYIFHRIIL